MERRGSATMKSMEIEVQGPRDGKRDEETVGLVARRFGSGARVAGGDVAIDEASEARPMKSRVTISNVLAWPKCPAGAASWHWRRTWSLIASSSGT